MRFRMSEASTARGETGRVQSVARAASILRILGDAPHGLALKEIARRAGLAPSTCHRLLTTLEPEGFVRHDAAGGGWRVGVGLYAIGAAFRDSRDLQSLARPHLRALMETTGETANLFVLEQGQVVCVGQVESRQPMRAITAVGGRVAPYCSGAGKAILAALPEAEARAFLAESDRPRLTARTLTDLPALEAALHETRARGWALDDGEHAESLRCVAAAIHDEEGAPIAAVSVSGPASRLDDAAVAALGPRVRRAAAAVTRDYGGRVPPRAEADPARARTPRPSPDPGV